MGIMNARTFLGKMAVFFTGLSVVLTIGLSGCSKDYDAQILYLNERIDSTQTNFNTLRNDVNAQLAQIQGSLSDIVTIDRVVNISDGTTSGIKIYMTDGKEYTLTNGAITYGCVWTVDQTTGKWRCDGVLTEFSATGTNPKPPYVNPVNNTWYIPQWDASQNTYVNQSTGIKATDDDDDELIVYVTGTPGYYYLHVKDTNNNWVETPLFSSSSGGSVTTGGNFIEILGYINATPPGDLSLSSISTANMLLTYGWLQAFPEGLTGWNYQKQVQVNQILSTLRTQNTFLIINTNLASTALTGLKLRNSYGTSVPIKFGTPQPFSGLLTRSGGPSAGTIYFLSMDDDVQTNNNQFYANALYYLETSSGVKSNYTTWAIATAYKSANQAVESHVAALGGQSPDGSGVFTVAKNTDITVVFDTHSAEVYDYYITGKNNVTIDIAHGTFRAITDISPADTVIVHALHIDGVLHHDTLRIQTQ